MIVMSWKVIFFMDEEREEALFLILLLLSLSSNGLKYVTCLVMCSVALVIFEPNFALFGSQMSSSGVWDTLFKEEICCINENLMF